MRDPQRNVAESAQILVAAFVPPDCRRAVSASFEGDLTEWDLDKGEPVAQSHEPKSLHAATSVSVSADGVSVLTANKAGILQLWDLREGTNRVLPSLPATEDDSDQ